MAAVSHWRAASVRRRSICDAVGGSVGRSELDCEKSPLTYLPSRVHLPKELRGDVAKDETDRT